MFLFWGGGDETPRLQSKKIWKKEIDLGFLSAEKFGVSLGRGAELDVLRKGIEGYRAGFSTSA